MLLPSRARHAIHHDERNRAGIAAYWNRHGRTTGADTRARDIRTLAWMWAWGVVDRYIVQDLLGVSRASAGRVLTRLRRHHLIQAVPTDGTPAVPWMLTNAGAETIGPYLGEDDLTISPVTRLDRANQNTLARNLLVQRFAIRVGLTPTPVIASLTADAGVTASAKIKIRPIRQAQRSAFRLPAGVVPDAIVDVIDAGPNSGSDVIFRAAVKCQQTVEPADKVARIMAGYCAALRDRALSAVVYCGTRPHILSRYQRAMSFDLREWIRAPSRHWVAVPDSAPYAGWMYSRVVVLADPAMETQYYHTILPPPAISG